MLWLLTECGRRTADGGRWTAGSEQRALMAFVQRRLAGKQNSALVLDFRLEKNVPHRLGVRTGIFKHNQPVLGRRVKPRLDFGNAGRKISFNTDLKVCDSLRYHTLLRFHGGVSTHESIDRSDVTDTSIDKPANSSNSSPG